MNMLNVVVITILCWFSSAKHKITSVLVQCYAGILVIVSTDWQHGQIWYLRMERHSHGMYSKNEIK